MGFDFTLKRPQPAQPGPDLSMLVKAVMDKQARERAIGEKIAGEDRAYQRQVDLYKMQRADKQADERTAMKGYAPGTAVYQGDELKFQVPTKPGGVHAGEPGRYLYDDTGKILGQLPADPNGGVKPKDIDVDYLVAVKHGLAQMPPGWDARRVDEALKTRSNVYSTWQYQGVSPEGQSVAMHNRTGDTKIVTAPGGGRINPKPENPTQGERERIQADDSAVNELNRVKGLYKAFKVSGAKTELGPTAGRYAGIKEKFGGEGIGPFRVPTLNPDQVAFRNSLSSMRNTFIKTMTGAQMSEGEATRLADELLSPNLPDATFEPRMVEVERRLTWAQQRRREILSQTGVAGVPSIPGAKPPTGTAGQKRRLSLDEFLGGR